MTAGFIQGHAAEVKLADILPDEMKSASNKARKEAFAVAYEEKFPDVLVIRDWEDIPDNVIAQLDPKERAQAIEDRDRLNARRATRKPQSEQKRSTMDGDPERMGRELRRQRANLAGLTIDHPDYDRLFANYTNVIHELEDCCGIERTKFVKGETLRKESDPIPDELQAKLNKYMTLTRKQRKDSIRLGKDPALYKLFRDNEPDPELQEMIVTRLMQLEAL